jgi:hypothetical protein
MGSPRQYPCTTHLISIFGKITRYIYIGVYFTVREGKEKFPCSLGGPAAQKVEIAPMDREPVAQIATGYLFFYLLLHILIVYLTYSEY